MNMTFVRFISRLLVVCLIGLPFQAQAGLMGTDTVVSTAQAQVARDAVTSFMSRSEVAGQLQSMGLTPQAAKDRVAALTDAEVSKLAGQIQSLPAGAADGLVLLILVGVLIWWLVKK